MILCFEREGFNLEIKPLFEFTGAFFADKDLDRKILFVLVEVERHWVEKGNSRVIASWD